MILITGGSGYVGGLVAAYFQKLGYKVGVTTRNKKNISLLSLKNCEIFETDLLELNEVIEVCKNVKFIFHFASMNSKDSEHTTNKIRDNIKKVTNNLLQAAIQNSIEKFLYLSTAHVYGKNLINEVAEDTTPSPILQYAKNHLETEKILTDTLKDKEIELMILRLSNMVAAPSSIETKCWHLIAHDACKQAVRNKKIVLRSNGNQLRDFFSIYQLYNVIHDFISSEKKYSGIYNLGSGSSISIKVLINIIRIQYFKIFQDEIDVIFGDEKMTNNEFTFNIDKIRNDLPNINSYSLDDIIYELLLFCKKSFL